MSVQLAAPSTSVSTPLGMTPALARRLRSVLSSVRLSRKKRKVAMRHLVFARHLVFKSMTLFAETQCGEGLSLHSALLSFVRLAPQSERSGHGRHARPRRRQEIGGANHHLRPLQESPDWGKLFG